MFPPENTGDFHLRVIAEQALVKRLAAPLGNRPRTCYRDTAHLMGKGAGVGQLD